MEWIVQWYTKVPADAKGYWKVPLVAILPLSNKPVFEVTVCGVLSMFVQVTVVPVLIIIVSGTKAKFEILTIADVPVVPGAMG